MLRLWLAGDVHRASDLPLFEGVGPSGFGIVNLEGAIDEGHESERVSDKLLLRNSPRVVAALQSAHVVIAGIANNHRDDLGAQAKERTRAVLKAAGIETADVASPAYVQSGGFRIATIADLVEEQPLDLRMQITDVRTRADVVLVSLHTLGEPSYFATPALEITVQRALEAAPDVIVVHGSHWLAKVQRIGTTVVAWGLGNLAFDCDCSERPEGALLELEFGQSARGAKLRPTARFVPISPGHRELAARPLADPEPTLQLLQSLGSAPLSRVDRGLEF